MALMQITAFPLGTGSTSVGEFVADFQRLLAGKKGLSYTLTDMGTTIEGEADELLRLAADIHRLPFAKGAQRVITQLTIDDRRDQVVRLGDKINSVQNRL